MKLTIFFFAFVCQAAYSAKLAKNNVGIVGGSNASIEDYPYQVSVQFLGFHGCGGSILNEEFIVTAAHCTYDSTAEQITVRVGSSFRNTGGKVYDVARIHQHPQYEPGTFDNDIALLELASKLEMGKGVRKISLATAGTVIPTGLPAVATGWGRLSEDGIASEQLQMVVLPTISTENCKNYYPASYVTDNMFCAGYDEGGKDTCEGDSGGPLVVSGIQIGLTSWGSVCGQAGSPGAYTKLSQYEEYINSILNQSS